MKAAIIDSSVFLALEDPAEVHHEAARSALENSRTEGVTFATTNFVFDEAYTLILSRLGRDRAIAWGTALRASSMVRVLRVTQADEERAWDILSSFDDKLFSYTDATTFAVAESTGIDGALALDQHFVQWGRLEVRPLP